MATLVLIRAETRSPSMAVHRNALDGVRGIAILMVLAVHTFQSNYESGGLPTRLLGTVCHFGNYGVDLFFVLSGFLITGVLLDTRSDPHFFRNFFSRRILRLFPLYYGVLLCLFCLTPLLHFHWNGMAWLLVFDLQNLRPFQIENLSLSGRIGLFHFWSLAVEEQFYLFWPFVLFFVRSRRVLFNLSIALCAGAIAARLFVILAHLDLYAAHVNTLCRADSLILGGMLVLLSRTAHWQRLLPWARAGFLLTLAALVLTFPITASEAPSTLPRLLWSEGFRYTVAALCAASLIAWSLSPGSLAERFLSHRFLRFFGKYSYGIYVLHPIFLGMLGTPLRAIMRNTTHSPGLAVVGSGLISVMVAVVAAILSFHFYEKPFLRLKHRFDARVPSLRWSTGRRPVTLGNVVEVRPASNSDSPSGIPCQS